MLSDRVIYYNFNNFLTALTSHFDSLTLDENQEDLEVPNDYLVDAQQIYRKLKPQNHRVLTCFQIKS
jgi:hypothetical protein